MIYLYPRAKQRKRNTSQTCSIPSPPSSILIPLTRELQHKEEMILIISDSAQLLEVAFFLLAVILQRTLLVHGKSPCISVLLLGNSVSVLNFHRPPLCYCGSAPSCYKYAADNFQNFTIIHIL